MTDSPELLTRMPWKSKKPNLLSSHRMVLLPEIGQVPNISMWAFDADEGALSRTTAVYNGQGDLQSYVIAEISEAIEAGHRPFDEVKDICRSRLELEKRIALAKTYAEKIKDKVKSAASFADLVAADPGGKLNPRQHCFLYPLCPCPENWRGAGYKCRGIYAAGWRHIRLA